MGFINQLITGGSPPCIHHDATMIRARMIFHGSPTSKGPAGPDSHTPIPLTFNFRGISMTGTKLIAGRFDQNGQKNMDDDRGPRPMTQESSISSNIPKKNTAKAPWIWSFRFFTWGVFLRVMGHGMFPTNHLHNKIVGLQRNQWPPIFLC